MAKPKNHEWSKARKLFYKQRHLWRLFNQIGVYGDKHSYPPILQHFNGVNFREVYVIRGFLVPDILHRMRTMRQRGFSPVPVAKEWLKRGYTYM